MNRYLTVAAVGIAAITTSLALTRAGQDGGATPPDAMQLPPGWTEADMQACMDAATPGPMHKRLAESAGVWQGKTHMWMAPDSEPLPGECTATITAILDGRYLQTKIEAADMPGMGPFSGFGISGYDNVTKQFQNVWIDSCGTGIMRGAGSLSPDGKVLTWTCVYNCPIRKGTATMREIERFTGPNTMTFEMYGTDPKSGREYKMMEIAYTRSNSNSNG